MLRLTAELESFLSAKSFISSKLNDDVMMWENGLTRIYVIQDADAVDAFTVFYRKFNVNGDVALESKFGINSPADIPAIESFINFNLPMSGWNTRDR